MRKYVALGLLVAALTACVPQPPPGRGPNPTLTVSTFVTGLDHAWDIAFTPDGNWMVYDDRPGRIFAKPFPSGTARLLGNVSSLQSSPNFVAQGEGGLLGLAIDPSFATNHFLYGCYDTQTDIRIVRFTVASNLAAGTLAIDRAIVPGLPVNAAIGRHSGCRPRFHPATGQLFIGTGDTASNGTIAENLHSLGGKVLCVDRDGNPCANNPGVTNPGLDIDDRIWSWGHRNVQGIAFKPSGAGYSIEHGPDRDDEVNVLFHGDFGWNPVPAGGGVGYNEGVPMTRPGAIVAAWSSGSPTIAPSGGTFLTGNQWKGWNGALAIAVLKGSELLVMFFDDDFGFTSIGTTFSMTGAGRLRSAVEGPDGNLYVSTDNGSGNDVILRAVPS